MKSIFLLLILACMGMAVVACSSSDDEKKSTALTLGDLTVNDHGTKDVTGVSKLTIEADDFYFSPTFLKGTAGQKLTLEVENESNTLHNISGPSVSLDKDIPAKGKVEVEVTFAQSGVMLFRCKYHAGQGMNGELLTGNAAPGPASAVVAAPTVKVSDSATLGKILTSDTGKTLYIYKNDVVGSGKSAVSGQLAVAWPPLTIASGNPVKPAGLNGELAVITRDDGSKQVTYNGAPLYFFAQDVNPGDVIGQARGNVWFVINP